MRGFWLFDGEGFFGCGRLLEGKIAGGRLLKGKELLKENCYGTVQVCTENFIHRLFKS
jgi:hypothetical protein